MNTADRLSLPKLIRGLNSAERLFYELLPSVNKSTSANALIERKLSDLEDLVKTIPETNSTLYKEWEDKMIRMFKTFVAGLNGDGYPSTNLQQQQSSNVADTNGTVTSTSNVKDNVPKTPENNPAASAQTPKKRGFVPLCDSETLKNSAQDYVDPKPRPPSPHSEYFDKVYRPKYNGEVNVLPKSHNPRSPVTLPPNYQWNLPTEKSPTAIQNQASSVTASPARKPVFAISPKLMGWNQTSPSFSKPQTQPVKSSTVPAQIPYSGNAVGKPQSDNDINWAAPPSLINAAKASPSPSQMSISYQTSPSFSKPQAQPVKSSTVPAQIPTSGYAGGKPQSDNDINWAAPPSRINAAKASPSPLQMSTSSEQQQSKPLQQAAPSVPISISHGTIPMSAAPSSNSIRGTSSDSSLSRSQSNSRPSMMSCAAANSGAGRSMTGNAFYDAWIRNMSPSTTSNGSDPGNTGRVSRGSNIAETNSAPPKPQQEQTPHQNKPQQISVNGGSGDQSNVPSFNILNSGQTIFYGSSIPAAAASSPAPKASKQAPQQQSQPVVEPEAAKKAEIDYDFNDWAAPPK